jgi:UDP-GlcNAc:undecaprenyl-phosphate/decaprenyl-phosphate GlcNAc-1-phosphate transferase
VAVALRVVPYRDDDGGLLWAGTLGIAAAATVALAASVYLVYVLEILKWRRTPVIEIVRQNRLQRAADRGVAGPS